MYAACIYCLTFPVIVSLCVCVFRCRRPIHSLIARHLNNICDTRIWIYLFTQLSLFFCAARCVCFPKICFHVFDFNIKCCLYLKWNAIPSSITSPKTHTHTPTHVLISKSEKESKGTKSNSHIKIYVNKS